MIIVSCKCGQQFQASDEHAGLHAACPKCGTPIVIPGKAAPVKPEGRSAGVTPAKRIVPALAALKIRGSQATVLIVAGTSGVAFIAVSITLAVFFSRPRTQMREIRDPFIGTVYQTTTYEDETGRLVKHGPEVVRNHEGQKQLETYYSHGEKQGVAKEWYPDGQRKFEGEFSRGKRHGKHTYWNQSGEIVRNEQFREDNPHGWWTVSDDTGKREEGNYLNGAKEGVWTTYHSNGKKFQEGEFRNGSPNGIWTQWHANGEKKARGHFQGGKQQGRWTFWHDNGQKLTECEYRAGKVHGLWPSWDSAGRKLPLLTTLSCADGCVTSASFSRNSKTLAVGISSGIARFWSMESGQQTEQTANTVKPGGATMDVAYSPDGKLLACCSTNGTVTIWDAESLTLQSTFKHGDTRVSCVAFSPDSKTLASGSSALPNKSVKIWNLATGEAICTIPHREGVYAVAFAPDAQSIASGSADGAIVWSAATGQSIHVFKTNESHDEIVWSLGFSRDGKMLGGVVGGFHGSQRVFKLWDLSTFTERFSADLRGAKWEGLPLAFSPDGVRVAVGNGRAVLIYDVITGKQIQNLSGNGKVICCLAFSPDGRLLASGASSRAYKNGEVKVWDVSGP